MKHGYFKASSNPEIWGHSYEKGQFSGKARSEMRT
jgi:hypothetical protein